MDDNDSRIVSNEVSNVKALIDPVVPTSTSMYITFAPEVTSSILIKRFVILKKHSIFYTKASESEVGKQNNCLVQIDYNVM